MKIKYSLHEPILGKKEIKNCFNALKSGWISPSGKFVNKFEKKIEKYTKSKCILTNSGTSALHLSLILSNVKQNEEVLVPAISFIATVNVVLYLKAIPVFFDCEKDNPNVDLLKLMEFLENNTYTVNKKTVNKKTKRVIKAIILTHVFGLPIGMEKLKKVLAMKNIKLIEDAAEALGSYTGKNHHCGTQGDYGILSFNANKIITTAGGGALLLKKKKDLNRAKVIIAQGKIDNIFFYHKELGFNYGMSNISAGIGLGQFSSLNERIKRKKIIHQIYKKSFENEKKFKFVYHNKNLKTNYWLNYIVLKKSNYKILKSIIKKINSIGIQVRPLWYPCQKQVFLKKYQSYKVYNAEQIFKKVMCLPSTHLLKPDEIRHISKKIITIINKEI